MNIGSLFLFPFCDLISSPQPYSTSFNNYTFVQNEPIIEDLMLQQSMIQMKQQQILQQQILEVELDLLRLFW